MSEPNAPRWTGDPGFYEVWYLTLTDRASGVGAWIRYTLLAPRAERGEPATCALWFLVMDPAGGPPFGRKATFPIGELDAAGAPFRVAIAGAELDDGGARGAFEDVAWDLRWAVPGGAYRHVHPLLERLGLARTVLELPHADLAVEGTLRWGERELRLDGARGGQAHLWGAKHASRWAWAHCNDFDGHPGDLLDGVSVWVPRLGRDTGPSTPVVARVGGRDTLVTAPHRVLTGDSRIALSGWSFDVGAPGGRRLAGQVDAPREQLAGVTYEDPDGEKAYCYNTEVATLRLRVYERGELADTLEAPGRAHFEYAQREPVPGIPLLTT